MKIYVRHAGGELMFPSFKDLQAMYKLKFVAPDDLVRRENSERWIRAADLPELRFAQQNDKAGRQFTMAMYLMVLGLAAALLFRFFFLSPAHL